MYDVGGCDFTQKEKDGLRAFVQVCDAYRSFVGRRRGKHTNEKIYNHVEWQQIIVRRIVSTQSTRFEVEDVLLCDELVETEMRTQKDVVARIAEKNHLNERKTRAAIEILNLLPQLELCGLVFQASGIVDCILGRAEWAHGSQRCTSICKIFLNNFE